ncbi:MAG: glycosyltransferase family 39 protein [Acidobacteriaceae bacterium]
MPSQTSQPQTRIATRWPAETVFYALCLAASISVWLLAIRAPLWLDETGSYWQISGGFSQLWARQSLSFVAYPGILWLWTRLFGVSEIALRTSSLLAMAAAMWMMYLAARELFDREIAFIAALIFCLDPIVAFTAVDIRPYSFSALATNTAIYLLLRLRRSDSNALAIGFGLAAAFIFYFQYLFAVILPALVFCFFLLKYRNPKTCWRQFALAAATFALAVLPTIPGVHYLFHTSGTHVFERSPGLSNLAWVLAPLWLFLCCFFAAAFAVMFAPGLRIRFDRRQAVLCAALALTPALLLFGISVLTPIHLFSPRHGLIAVPGVALCWAFLLSCFSNRLVRVFFCVLFVSGMAVQYYHSPDMRKHVYSWKYAIAVAEKYASASNAPVVICSDYPESDYAPMPLHDARQSNLFAQLAYYPLSVPVVPMPRSLNREALQVGSQFLAQAERQHEQFFAMACRPSWATLNWLTEAASSEYSVRDLGVYDSVKVLEFLPRTPAVAVK